MDAREILNVLLRKPNQINKTLPRPLLKRYEIDHRMIANLMPDDSDRNFRGRY
ncbi:hypothetical protein PLANPX_4462 [Lacipirellula parvula]|uniref:Uncharacterized protein n=1 Tax=Lacipirellula parvula TaxID=2650471 RepID=A0A5K7XDL5_9BACT|nr:hypothetical protein PLANPX_4462 [Lacipirellula parvula]